MKILSRFLFLLFVLAAVLIAVSNPQAVQLALWPLPHLVVIPVYLLMIGLLLLGVLAGLAVGWWTGRRHRRRARERGDEAARLERELGQLRETLAALKATTAQPEKTALREQKAIERQSALVTPDLLLPPARGPLAP